MGRLYVPMYVTHNHNNNDDYDEGGDDDEVCSCAAAKSPLGESATSDNWALGHQVNQ